MTISSKSVPLLDLRAQYDSIRDEIQSAILEVCESQHFVLGPRVIELENAVAEYSNSKYGIGVSSGSDALLIALMALDVGQGDEVITSPFTFFASAGAIARTGARPVFCDIDPDSFNLDASAVEEFINDKCHSANGQLINTATGAHIKALMPIHLFGQVADMGRLLGIADQHNLRIIEDAAQSLGAETITNERAGSMGDIGCFSFFPSKNLGAYGDGGLCTTQNEGLAEKLRSLRVHGSSPKYYHSLIGGNFRLDSIQAAILSVKLKYLDEWSSKRAANAEFYDAALGSLEELRIPSRDNRGRHVFNQYTLRCDARNALRQHLSDAEIGTEIYYPLPLHMQECFSYLGYKKGDFPHAESAAESVLSIPVYPELSTEQLQTVAQSINQFCPKQRHSNVAH